MYVYILYTLQSDTTIGRFGSCSGRRGRNEGMEAKVRRERERKKRVNLESR